MHIRLKRNNVNGKMPLEVWVLMAGSCLALTGAVLTLPTRTVQADALLPRPAAIAAPVAQATPGSLAPKKNTVEESMLHGVASWYGSVFNGRHTASGERFDMYAMTACHPTLPFGTRVRVVNRANHKSVVVRITDRGLLYDGRIIDLSYAAAQKLAMTKDGLAAVDLQVISAGGLRSNR
jgi:rare lipoprotein A